MADKTTTEVIEHDAADVAVSRIYEVGYHIVSSVKEEDLDAIVSTMRNVIEKAGGSFIAEGAPVLMKLAYGMEAREGDRNIEYDKAYFGWIKFEANLGVAEALEEVLKRDNTILRHIVFRTVREETRARIKAPALREVKRTDTIKAPARRPEESAAPVSEEDLNKALDTLTTE